MSYMWAACDPAPPCRAGFLCKTTACAAELVIGNIVRRVMHIIREEMEAENDGKEDELEAAVPERERPVGGLSKAFRCAVERIGSTVEGWARG